MDFRFDDERLALRDAATWRTLADVGGFGMLLPGEAGGATQPFDVAAGRVEVGTVSAMRVLESKIATRDEDENDQGCLGTAMHAVHAVGPVCAAPPGVRTFLDLPTIVGRHVLRRPTGAR